MESPRKRTRVHASALVEQVLRHHVPRELLRLERIRSHWDHIAPPQLAAHVQPGSVKGTTLWLHAHDHQWLHELVYWKEELLSRVRQECPNADITTLEARLGTLEPTEDLPRSRPLPPPKLSLPSTLSAAVEAVGDPELREVLKALRIRTP